MFLLLVARQISLDRHRQVVETPHCGEDEFQSQCICLASPGPSNVRRLAPLLRFTGKKLYKYSKSNMREFLPKRYLIKQFSADAKDLIRVEQI